MDYTIERARYAQKSIIVRASDGSDWKTRVARIVEAMHGRWSGRERGYILPATKETKLREYADDPRVDASVINKRLFCYIPEPEAIPA